ncbi:MAG: hypothetical protein KC910_09615 [Candidatus Eremiobacteraeota bacterium]|nr:hypothetical protein [Candidatus Eremiobacteraeota bacterium]
MPITLLASEGPQARAYLVRARQAGIGFSRILLMVSARNPAGKTVGRFLPGSWRRSYAEAVQTQTQLFWPLKLRRDRPDLEKAMAAGLAEVCPQVDQLYDQMYANFQWEAFAPVERVLVDGFKDPALAEHLQGQGLVLFSGGGIVPRSLLERPGLNMVHVHPGHLPYVRGGDGLLWSVLVRGCPGMSAFFMAPGIDMGDLIAAGDFPSLEFKLSQRPDDQTLYRALFCFCDPLLRAEFLATRLLEQDPTSWPAEPQAAEEGITYHFMHPSLRARALRKLFP